MMTEEELKEIETRYGISSQFVVQDDIFELVTEVRRLNAAYELCKQRFSEMENDMGDDAFRYTLIMAFEPEKSE